MSIAFEFIEISINSMQYVFETFGRLVVSKTFTGLPKIDTTAIDSKTMLKEMSMLNHPNLVQQFSTWSSGAETFMLFPHGKLGSSAFAGQRETSNFAFRKSQTPGAILSYYAPYKICT